jgi:gluconolactonase
LHQAIRSEFARIVPNPSVEKVAGGYIFTEGPVWDGEGGCVFFTDLQGDTINKFMPGQGEAVIYRKHGGNPNGLALDPAGRLIICEQAGRRVVRIDGSGNMETLAERFEGKKLNSPNDLVFFSDGSIFFTDPPFGIKPEEREQPCNGIYRLFPNGELTLLAGAMPGPNGLDFSPDMSTLYVADSVERNIRAFDVTSNGELTNERIFADLTDGKPGVPDGMDIDHEGNIFCTGPGGVWLFAPIGEFLGLIPVPEVTSNCAWGDDDGKTLYITACSGLYRIRVTTGQTLTGQACSPTIRAQTIREGIHICELAEGI